MRRMLLLFASTGLAACVVAQQPATSPANESREPVTVRSTNSIGSDRTVPLCPQHFHDSLARDGVAGRGDHGITPARIKTTVPALMTQQAIEAAGGTHIGNFNVIVNARSLLAKIFGLRARCKRGEGCGAVPVPSRDEERKAGEDSGSGRGPIRVGKPAADGHAAQRITPAMIR